jgi:flagellar basal body-associated protein FliL
MDEQGTDHGQAPVEKKKGKGPLIGIIVAAVLVVGAGAAGAVMGPKFFAKPAPVPAKSAEGEAEAEDDKAKAEDKASEDDKADEAADDEQKVEHKSASGEVKEVTNLTPIVVDTHSADGQIRHLKIALSIEHPDTMKEAEFKAYIPRAREAAIWYLRTHDFDELSSPKNFDKLRKDLNDNILNAVGKRRARRVLITDFVAQ